MNKNNSVKSQQLGMPHGTANNILKKNILFSLLVKYNENICYHCSEPICFVEELSIEHKIPYLYSDNPKELFFSLDNIAFSHLRCNVGARRSTSKLPIKHGTPYAWDKRKCRCAKCKEAKLIRSRKSKENQKLRRMNGIETKGMN